MERYIELCATLSDEQTAEIVEAELSDLGFEGFAQESAGEGAAVALRAYVPEREWPACREQACAVLRSACGSEPDATVIEPENWNAEWERTGFSPVRIDDDMIVRGEHHEPHPELGAFDIVVSPSMSFGTGHHATTRMMCRALRKADPAGRRVLDVGCGTGILSIVAARCGASRVDAVDIDSWAVESCRRSIVLSRVEDRVRPLLGGIEVVASDRYDVITANINRNIILSQMPQYAAALVEGGDLLTSGFLAVDEPAIGDCARRCGLSPAGSDADGEWRMSHFIKMPS